SASAVKELWVSPASKSRFITKRVMRVRGSFGLKLPSDDSENGFLLIDPDSSATARVEPADTLINVGLTLGAAVAGANAPHTNAVRPAHANTIRRSHHAK